VDPNEFISRLGHDLRAPLRHVHAFADLLKRRYAGQLDAEGQELLEYVYSGAVRAEAMVDALLTYSRILTRPASCEAVDSMAVVKDVRIELRHEIDQTAAEIVCGDLPAVYANPDLLANVFRNLLSNALKFRKPEEPPRISVSAAVSGGETVFSIRDNGIGIEEKLHERVFDVFYRVAPPGHGEGIGMGLPFSRRIIEKHGGRMWVESTPGVGSTFFFSLPARPVDG
jgi:light-regulated signal transduction histidine kinase (bacteriophytochrome)